MRVKTFNLCKLLLQLLTASKLCLIEIIAVTAFIIQQKYICLDSDTARPHFYSFHDWHFVAIRFNLRTLSLT